MIKIGDRRREIPLLHVETTTTEKRVRDGHHRYQTFKIRQRLIEFPEFDVILASHRMVLTRIMLCNSVTQPGDTLPRIIFVSFSRYEFYFPEQFVTSSQQRKQRMLFIAGICAHVEVRLPGLGERRRHAWL